MALFYQPELSKKIQIGMSQQEVIEVLGEPDSIDKGEVFELWEWERVSDGDDTVGVSISFLDGAVSGIEIQSG